MIGMNSVSRARSGRTGASERASERLATNEKE